MNRCRLNVYLSKTGKSRDILKIQLFCLSLDVDGGIGWFFSLFTIDPVPSDPAVLVEKGSRIAGVSLQTIDVADSMTWLESMYLFFK